MTTKNWGFNEMNVGDRKEYTCQAEGARAQAYCHVYASKVKDGRKYKTRKAKNDARGYVMVIERVA